MVKNLGRLVGRDAILHVGGQGYEGRVIALDIPLAIKLEGLPSAFSANYLFHANDGRYIRITRRGEYDRVHSIHAPHDRPLELHLDANQATFVRYEPYMEAPEIYRETRPSVISPMQDGPH